MLTLLILSTLISGTLVALLLNTMKQAKQPAPQKLSSEVEDILTDTYNNYFS
jgi:hypothetical protein